MNLNYCVGLFLLAVWQKFLLHCSCFICYTAVFLLHNISAPPLGNLSKCPANVCLDCTIFFVIIFVKCCLKTSSDLPQTFNSTQVTQLISLRFLSEWSKLSFTVTKWVFCLRFLFLFCKYTVLRCFMIVTLFPVIWLLCRCIYNSSFLFKMEVYNPYRFTSLVSFSATCFASTMA